MAAKEFYEQSKIEKLKVSEATIACRQFGQGVPLVFIHGFPTSGYTWRHLLVQLSSHYHCITFDLPGLGDSNWTEKTNFSSSAQADNVVEALRQKGINKFSLVAHNSGATVTRIIAIKYSDSVSNLIIFNTEIPFHRPPWIPFYQKVGLLPLVPNFIRFLLNRQWFVKSPMGFKEAYTDISMLDNPDNVLYYLTPFKKSKERTVGAFKYLKGIDWQVVDNFKNTHKAIKAKVLFLWGENDCTFPLKFALEMKNQFSENVQFQVIKNASLLPHEEKPKEICDLILKFLKTDTD